MVEEKHYRNPEGLNEILSDILGHSVTGDWDKDIPSRKHLGAYKKGKVEGRMGQEWGDLFEEQACSYLSVRLKESGWELRSREYINGEQYDCVGWRGPCKSKQSPDLVVEMYFPRPKDTSSFMLSKAKEKVRKMVRKLERVNARLKYIVIGVPKGDITCWEQPHPDIKVVFQEHRFKNIKLVKRRG